MPTVTELETQDAARTQADSGPATRPCAHCGLPAPAPLGAPADTPLFCCQGCASVHAALGELGLLGYYRVKGALDPSPRPASVRGERYQELDDEALWGSAVTRRADGCVSAELVLEGVHCAACVWLLERLPTAVPGVLEARVELPRRRLHLALDPARAQLSAVARVLDRLGYPPHLAKDGAEDLARRLEVRRELLRLAVAGACMGNAMLLAVALYAGEAQGMEPVWHHVFRWTSLGVGAISLLFPGRVFFTTALHALRARKAHMDIPIALGLIAGGLAGALAVVTGRGEIFFDSLTALVFLLLAGRFVQARHVRRAGDAVSLLGALVPTAAKRRTASGDLEVVAVERLRPGDVVVVAAHGSFPADGVVTEGRSQVDAALLTGEAAPLVVEPGSVVAAGMVNLAAELAVQVSAKGAETRLAKLARLAEASSAEKPPIVLLADRIAGLFLIGVMLAAVVAALAWAPYGMGPALERVVALLIVACPCALGLATPLAIAATLRRAAERDILIKSGAALEALAHPAVLYLDKTGTLTEGRLALRRFVGDDTVKPALLALERGSLHPAARAITAGLSAHAGAAAELKVESTEQRSEGGLSGVVGGTRIDVGSEAYLRGRGVDIPPFALEESTRSTADGLSPTFVARDGRVVAVAALGDELRADARDSVAALRALGFRPKILSGDHAAVVAQVANRLGIPAGDAVGGVSPEEKLRAVEEARRAGAVVMVGDGVNDAAALAAASASIAVHGGAEASLHAADIYIARPGLAPIVALARASRRTILTIRLGMAASVAYNVLAVTLAMAGTLTPLTAAILMPVSSLTVLALALAVRRFDDEARPWK